MAGEESPADLIPFGRRVSQGGTLDLSKVAIIATGVNQQNAVSGLGEVDGQWSATRSGADDDVFVFLLRGRSGLESGTSLGKGVLDWDSVDEDIDTVLVDAVVGISLRGPLPLHCSVVDLPSLREGSEGAQKRQVGEGLHCYKILER